MQILLIIAVIALFFIVLSNLGYIKSFGERITGRDQVRLNKAAMKEEEGPRDANQDDVMTFVVKLLNFIRRKRIRSVIPGMIRYGDKTVNISAILVGRGSLLGIYCVGFGGTVTIDPEAGEWVQNLSGKTRRFPNPVKTCHTLDQIMETTMKELFDEPLPYKTVAVFTVPGVVFDPPTLPENVYTVDTLFDYLREADWVSHGDIEMKKTADSLASLVPMKDLKRAVKKKK